MKINSINEVVSEKLEDLMTPGFIAEVTPSEADIMGAFAEDAIDLASALEAAYD